MSIQNNTNELSEILNMINMLDGGSSGDSSQPAQNTFQVSSGTCKYSGDINNDTFTTVNCGFKADLVIFYLMSNTYDQDTVLYSVGFPIDNKYHYTNCDGACGGGCVSSSTWQLVEFWVIPANNGFQFQAYYSSDDTYYNYTSNIKYVAYKFNHV